MFAFAVRLRRKKQPEKEVVKKQATSNGVKVGGGFLLLFFGSLFIFFELVGKCHCSGDIIGYIMAITGSTLIIFFCIKDLIQTIQDEDIEESGDQDIVDNESIGSSDCNHGSDIYSDIGNCYDNFKPTLISRELSPINENVKLDNGKDVKIIPCLPKIHSRVLKTEYELPTVVVDT